MLLMRLILFVNPSLCYFARYARQSDESRSPIRHGGVCRNPWFGTLWILQPDLRLAVLPRERYADLRALRRANEASLAAGQSPSVRARACLWNRRRDPGTRSLLRVRHHHRSDDWLYLPGGRIHRG